MTDRAKALRGAIAAAVGPGKVDVVLRAVVEELGVKSGDVTTGFTSNAALHRGIEALATLLEAAGEE